MARRIDPELAAAIARLPIELPKSLGLDDIPALRSLMDSLGAPVPESPAVERMERTVPCEPEVKRHILHPRCPGGPRPRISWIHCGGLVSGNYRSGDAMLQRWCEVLGCVCVSVAYRLAPEHPYPAALYDCYAGLVWTAEHADEIGAGGTIGVAGTSAGACLAAALAQLARDRGQVPLGFQVLIAPMLDDRATPSKQWDVVTWDRRTNETAWRAYLGEDSVNEVPAYAVPALAADVAGLPSTYLSVGGADLLFDEAIDYARRPTIPLGLPARLSPA